MNFVVAIVVGIVLAAPVLALVRSISREGALDLLAVQLGAIAAVYVGSSLAGGSFAVLAVEVIGVTAFVVVALFGRWWSTALLAAGYFAHGVWDLLHELGLIATYLPEWYAPFCLGYDGIVGAFVALAFLRRGD